MGLLCLDVNDGLLVWLFISNRRWPPPPGPSSLCSSSLAAGWLGGPPTYCLEVLWAPSAAVTGGCAPSEVPRYSFQRAMFLYWPVGASPWSLCGLTSTTCVLSPIVPNREIEAQRSRKETRTGGSADSGPRGEVLSRTRLPFSLDLLQRWGCSTLKTWKQTKWEYACPTPYFTPPHTRP